jgi:hypothetical protein
MHVYNKKIVTNAVMNTTVISDPYNVQQLYGVAIQVSYTGTPTGTFKLQASADPATAYASPSSDTPLVWSDIINSPYSVTAAGDYMWNVFEIMYNYIRVVYTDTSGGTSTAVLNARINTKGP